MTLQNKSIQQQAPIPNTVDVRKLRKSLGLTQEAFAARYGFNIHTLRQWEQKLREPESPTRAYLLVIERIPGDVARALGTG